ncbi:hypothetical protein RJ639_040678 [Escallonia herrerae]|uniref:AMP-activated protein kinase glycogen-binding domain-containing protein n=1 Tax=Escallonia herrerae TaxID=1293975 RepID=A0AA88WF47_9ASTE|nr:hypothetical protein RJ639_040678 [Escallonia herrerae]
MGDEDDAGIEGILKRLEKQRNLSFGINLGGNGGASRASSKDDTEHMRFGDLIDADRADLEKISRLTSGGLNKKESESLLDKSGGKLRHSGSLSDVNDSRNSAQPEMWRSWSFQRAGFSETEFEAAEISFNKNQTKTREDSKDEILGIAAGATEALDRQIGTSHNQIRTHLQHLELELASALRLMRSKNEEYIVKGNENSLSDLLKLSDAWEFQETELMNAQDKLRSIRAKLAVLEGKMALAIIDAQKIVEEKQKSIDAARRALQLLRTVRIVWPNSASEVLLAGSFDGWTTKRKMGKSTTGIFSVQLKLYPGRYEIKFIVDGVWRIDPLRPIVHSKHENNLLIIT